MNDELKVSIIKAIANHYISIDEMDESLIRKQAETIKQFLEQQKKIYEHLKKSKRMPHKLKTNSKGEVIFEKGTLIHCAGRCDYDKLCGIKEKGILAGDFVGIPELKNDESYFCADFYRADKQMQGSDFIERIQKSDSSSARGPFAKGLKNITNIAFIFDSTEELSRLTDTDMYRPENSTHTMQAALKLLENYKGEKNGQISAIPYGIPSAFISGIVAGDGLLQDKSYIKLINQMFPNCYILNREGKIFFSPELTPEQNKENQLKCLEAIPEQEEWKKEIVKNTIESLLSGAIKATEETTRTNTINQVRNIRVNKNIKEMIKKNMMFGGRITNKNGFIMFQRLSFEELENIDESQMAYATQSMGRSVFIMDSNGKIKNYKGVDSHLDNKEISASDLVGAKSVYISNPGKSYLDSTYPINLVIFLGKKVDVRIRGGAPLEDLEIEADINAKMQGMGIKLPKIVSVKEIPYELARSIGLPIKIKGSYEEFTSDYAVEDKERKENLRNAYGESYITEEIQGLRPERISEYFARIGVFESEEFQQFAKENNVTIEDFANYVDKMYSLGQRYGQAERVLESPFRIADLEYYIKKRDVEAIQNIVAFSEELQQGQVPMENVFARQMGINIANMMNYGWMCENFVHRQDYTLAGEMCDDSYFDVVEHLKSIDDRNKDNEWKRKAIRENVIRKYFCQIYLIGSNVKVLQDEMILRGKSEEEIDSVLSDFVDTFSQNVDFDRISEKFSIKPEKVKKIFINLIGIPRDYAKLMASESREKGVILDEAVLFAHNNNNEFYNKLSSKLALKLNIDRNMIVESQDFLRSAIYATEVATRTSSITEQTKTIQTIISDEKETTGNEKI